MQMVTTTMVYEMPGVGCKACRQNSAGRYGSKAPGKTSICTCILHLKCNQSGWPSAVFVINTVLIWLSEPGLTGVAALSWALPSRLSHQVYAYEHYACI